MPSLTEVKKQLQLLGVPLTVLVKSEVSELPNVLFDDEVIQKVVYGWYGSGFALLVATTNRLVFIDKIAFKVIVEDIPYTSIMELEYDIQLFGGKLVVYARPNTIKLSGIKKDRLRDFAHFVQQKLDKNRRTT